MVVYYFAFRNREISVGGALNGCKIIRENGRGGAGNIQVANFVVRVARKGEHRHMAILATDHFPERIVGAVIGADLPLRAQVFQPIIGYVLTTRVHVDFCMLKVSRSSQRHSNVMTRIAEGARTQEVDLGGIVARYVKVAFYSEWLGKRPHLLDSVVDENADVSKPITLKASAQIGSADVVAEVTSDAGCA